MALKNFEHEGFMQAVHDDLICQGEYAEKVSAEGAHDDGGQASIISKWPIKLWHERGIVI